MRIIRIVVVAIETVSNIRISRAPLEKFYGDFIDQVNLDLVSQSKGVLHIGAHLGIESHEYDQRGKPVLWVEADPLTFKDLEKIYVNTIGNRHTTSYLAIMTEL